MKIAIEGLDGVGKSTILNKLQERLVDFLFTKEPGSKHDDICQKIRALFIQEFQSLDPYARELLLCADRMQHYKAISNFENVITDRSVISGHVYARYSGGIPLNVFSSIFSNNFKYDLVFYIRRNEEEAKNKEAIGEAYDSHMNPDNRKELDSYFIQVLADGTYSKNYHIIYNNSTIDEVCDEIIKKIKECRHAI